MRIRISPRRRSCCHLRGMAAPWIAGNSPRFFASPEDLVHANFSGFVSFFGQAADDFRVVLPRSSVKSKHSCDRHLKPAGTYVRVTYGSKYGALTGVNLETCDCQTGHFSLLRSAIMCLRGSRSATHRPASPLSGDIIDLSSAEGRVPNED